MGSGIRPIAGRLAVVLTGLQGLLVCGGLLYRATVYRSIPVARGEPYGLGDILDLLIWLLLVGSSVLTLITAAVLSAVPTLRSWRAIAVLTCAGLVALPAYYLLHPLAARLSYRAAAVRPAPARRHPRSVRRTAVQTGSWAPGAARGGWRALRAQPQARTGDGEPAPEERSSQGYGGR